MITPTSTPPSSPSAAASGPEQAAGVFRAGSLRYTRPELAHVFLWLLGGDFAFAFFEQVFGRFIPLFARDLGGSNALIGIMTGSVAGLCNFFFLPNISMRSDRHRGAWGRRIPFLLWATPCTVVSLLLVGFAPEVGRTLHGPLSRVLAVNPVALNLALLCVFVVSYHFWNMILNNAYSWLIRDVVPTSVVGWFLSWFRTVTTLASFLFLWWVFPHVLTHRQQIFPAIGGIYAAIFLAMCWRVREGEYPPPAPSNHGALERFFQYFRRCLALPIYRCYFLVYVLMVAATTSVSPFLSLLARERLGLGMDDMGKIFAWGMLASALAYLPMGWVCSRFKPIRVVFAGLVGMSLTSAGAYFLVHDRTTWLVYTLLVAVPQCAWVLGCSAFTIELFPAEEFGQFSAGMNVFSYGALAGGNFLLGVLIDRMHSHYEVAFVWGALMSVAALVPLWRVYRGWLAHGGPGSYVPPRPD